MWSNLDNNLKENNFTILTVNAHSITGQFADLVTNQNLVTKRFSYIIVTKRWPSYDSYIVLEINGYKPHSIIAGRAEKAGKSNDSI